MTDTEITALAELCAAAEADYADDWNAAIEADERPDLWEPPVVEVQVRALRALLAERSAPTPPPVQAVTREELVEIIQRSIPIGQRPLTCDFEAAADAILSRLGETK